MHRKESLPIVLISASDSICANKIVSELIDDKSNLEDHEISEECRIWRIVNKYYSAEVKLQPLVDGQPPPLHLAGLVEAHLIYLRADESEECADRRLVEAGVLSHESHVKLAVAEGPESDALAAWAFRNHYELVTLSEERSVDGEESDEDEAKGVGRVRDALHAHTWTGLIRLDRSDAPLSIPDDAFLSDAEAESGDSWGSWEAWRGEAGREGGGGSGREGGGGAREFAGLLGSLGAERSALGALADADRRRSAERVLAAFRAALLTSDDTP